VFIHVNYFEVNKTLLTELRAVIQRVLSPAKVEVNNDIVGQIDKGLVVLLGIEPDDNNEDIKWLANKIAGLRIFNDNDAIMNLSIKDIGGSLLIISQFTLYASTRKGNRPSYIKAAKPEIAKQLYNEFNTHIAHIHNITVVEGVFGADMKVSFINDGPVTIIIDTKVKE
jgi:D-aminoacyl-tRNA deacylase